MEDELFTPANRLLDDEEIRLGDFSLRVEGDHTVFKPSGPPPKGIDPVRWRPIRLTGRFPHWGKDKWKFLKLLATERFPEFPDLGKEIDRAMGQFVKRSVVSRIEVKSCREVFGDSAYHPDRPAAIVWAENGARLVLGVPLGVKYVDGRWEVFDREAFERSVGYKKSKFGAFIRKYGWPKVGLEVETAEDERGYLTIDIS